MLSRPFPYRRSRPNKTGRGKAAARRLRVELLEDRALLATNLVWDNQGIPSDDTDNFNAVYGSNAAAARAIVNQALSMWEQVIDVYQALGGPESTLFFEIEAADLGGNLRGSALGFDITMDDDGAGAGWYFDPVPGDSSEFPNIVNPFMATGGPAGADFFRTIVHEMGHALGFNGFDMNFTALLLTGAQMTDVGVDQVDNSSDLTLLTPAGEPGLITFTDSGGLHIYEGPPDPNFPGAPVLNNDLMNAGRTIGQGRQLISEFDGTVLAKAFGHSILKPSCLPNFSYYAHLNLSSSPGVLTVNGEMNPSSSDDQVVLSLYNLNNTDFISVKVTDCDISFPRSAVTQIVVQPTVVTDGNDTITIDLSSGNWIPTGGITVNGGVGTNTLLIKGPPGANTAYSITGSQVSVSGSAGAISYSNIADMTVSAEPTSTDNIMAVSGTGALANLTLVGSDGPDDIIVTSTDNALQKLQIDALDGPDAMVIEGLTSVLKIDAGGGDDLVQFAPTGGTLDPMPSAKALSIDGQFGSDLLVLNDFNVTSDQLYSFNVDFSNFPAGEGGIVRGFQFYFHFDVEQVILNAGSGADDFFVRGTPVDSHLTIFAADGDDEFEVATNSNPIVVGDIHSLVNIHGGNGANTAILDDRGDNSGDTVTVTETTVGAGANDNYFGLGGKLEYHALAELTIITSRGADIINVESTAVGTETTINASRGNDQITVTAPPDPSDGKGQGRRNGTADEIKSILTINGELGANTLTVIDTSDTTGDHMTLTDTTIGMGAADTFLGVGGGIVYTSIATLTVLLGSGGNDAVVESTHVNTNKVFLKTGTGADTLLVQNPAGNVNQIRSQLDIDGQGGQDTATVDDGVEAAASTLTLTPNQVLGNGTYFGSGGELSYTAWELLNVRAGLAGDTAVVTGTKPGTETHLATGGGIDLVTVSSAGVVNLVRSLLDIDGEGQRAVVALLDGADPTGDQVSITDLAVGAEPGDTFFGPGGRLSYTNLQQLNLLAGTGLDLIQVLSTNSLTPLLLGGGGGDDIFRVDSNGAALGGTVDAITSLVRVFGGLGNNGLILNDTDDLSGDVVSVRPTGATAGHVGNGLADTFFGSGGVVEYNEMAVVNLRTSNASDTVHAAPAPTSSGTVLSVLGGGPTPLNPLPHDTLNLDLTGVAAAKLALLGLGAGQLSSSTHTPLFYDGVEVIDEVAGNLYDLVVDTNAAGLPGNDGIADVIEAFNGQLAGSKTLDLRINGSHAFTGYEAAISSLHVIGSGDGDAFRIRETAAGLPQLPGDPDGNPLTDPGHTNAAFVASGRTPANVSIHFDGGTGSASDSVAVVLITPPSVAKFDDAVGPAKSGVVNVDQAFTMSYVNLEPVHFEAAGGTLTVDASLLTSMTELLLTDLGDGRARISGDGGFEETTYGGFDHLIVVAPNQIQLQSSYWVNTTGDAADANPGDGVCQIAVGSNLCTLRAAIEESNAVPGPGNILFNIPGPGPHTIQPTSALPTIADPVFIDAVSQPGSVPNTLPIELGTNAQIMVEVNGGLITDGSSGLVITAGSSRVRGLAVTGFGYPDMGAPGSPEDVPAGGIVLLGPGYNVIEGNFIGVDPSTGAAEPNNFYGIFISSSHNQIGGPHPASRNLISGNQGFGIQLTGRQLPASAQFTPTEFNRIQGNLIGTDRTGNFPLPNTGAGIVLRLHARNNLIGGAHANLTPVRNIISGNGGPFAPLGDPSGPYQDWPDAPYPLDGGHGQGIHIANLTTFTKEFPVPNTIQGNYIGTNAQGTAALPNLHGGVSTGFTNNVTIGGASGALSSSLCSGVCNLISGNAQWGVGIANFLNIPSSAVVQGNFIGTDRTGTQPIGNHDDGVIMFLAEGNHIGGDTSDKGNLIAFNGRTGVLLRGHPAWNNPSRNTIRLNSIHSNGLLGIDLDDSQTFGDGPTLNDPGDADDGPNGLQNFPVLTSAQFGPATLVAGNVNSLPLTNLMLDFYTSTLPDPTGFGEGQRYLGSTTVQTNSSGDAPFSLLLPGGTQPGEFITATATSPSGDTSEFSPAINSNIFLDNSVLRVLGTDGDDVIAVTRQDDQYVVTADFLPPAMPSLSFQGSLVAAIDIATLAGNDQVAVIQPPDPDFPLDPLQPFSIRMDGGVDDDVLRLAWVGFNPQPEPPVDLQVVMAGGDGNDVMSFLGEVSFNPQPEPPVDLTHVSVVMDGGAGADVIDVLVAQAELKLAMDVTMGQGDDAFTAEFKPAEFKPAEFQPAEFKMAVDMGHGDNVFELLAGDVSFDVLELDARAGNGADVFDLKYQDVAITESLTQTISAGHGADRIGLVWQNVTVNSSVATKLKGDAGADVIDVIARGGYVAADGLLRLSMDGKGGNDILRAEIVDLLLDGQLDLALSGGPDNDTLAALVHVDDRSRGTFSGVLDGGDGDDALLFELLALDSLKIKRALADGGRGLDRCRASRNVSVVNCEA